MPKVLELIYNCNGCPNHRYDSGGKYECLKTGEHIDNGNVIAPFCPLVDYPSGVIAGMEQTIKVLREPYAHTFITALLSHVATKLGTTLDSNKGIEIKLENEDSVYISYQNIAGLDPRGIIYFFSGGNRYSLMPDNDEPELKVEVKREGEERELWQRVWLAK